MMMDGMTGRYRWPVLVALVVVIVALGSGVALAARGAPGPPTTSTTSTTEAPTDPGPISNESETGTLFGDLYKVLRYHGDEPIYDEFGGEIGTQVGGAPILSDAPGWYVAEGGDETNPIFTVEQMENSQVLQPVADFARWGDIWGQRGVPTGPTDYERGLSQNRIPLIITYDPTWDRFEAEVGLLTGMPSYNDDGTLNFTDPDVIDEYFIQPMGSWPHPVTGDPITYVDGVLWTDLLQPVDFGRISVSRSPEAVLQSSFDEAINAINSDDTIAIEIDSAGRLLLTKNVYDANAVDEDGNLIGIDPSTGELLPIGTTKKAIDSPLENLALYTKLITDGHLVTAAEEREPIDRSLGGGIPIWKQIQLEDGPEDALRPVIDMEKMRSWGLGNLVLPVGMGEWYIYYLPVSEPVVNEGKGKPDQDVEEPSYVYVGYGAEKPDPFVLPPDAPADTELAFGIQEDVSLSLDSSDYAFAASFLAAAADKTGHIGVDFVVYLNSILGINDVFADPPVFMDFAGVTDYDRVGTFAARGEQDTLGGDGSASTYTGEVNVLQQPNPEGMATVWQETMVDLTTLGFDSLGEDATSHFPNGTTATNDILGFTQMADDDLSVIEFIHTYQIPERR